MTMCKYSKLELAESQLKTAIGLFISGQDKFSVITLAGAADVILSQLVTIEGKNNFSKICLGDDSIQANNLNYKEYGKQINDTLYINALKHYDEGESEFVEIDTETCAIAAILKAIVNLKILDVGDRDFIQAFMVWMHLNKSTIDGI